jgi:hypothetical protein
MKKLLLFCLTILIFCGWSMPTGWQYPSLAIGTSVTSGQTLTSSQSGTIIVFTGSNASTFTLPTATIGLDFTIISGAAYALTVTPQSADIITFASKSAGQTITNSSAAVADSIELVCMQAGHWYLKSKIGTWS